MKISPEDFVHLHSHTDNSMLDGAARIPDLVKEVARLGQKAVAITDHGVLHGAYDLWKECQSVKKQGIEVKPIIGVEAYVTPGTSRHDAQGKFFGGPYDETDEDRKRRRDDVSASGMYTHMTLWAETQVGLQNLIKQQTEASLERAINKWARVDRDELERFSKGIIATSGCPSGAIQTYLRLGQYDNALREAGELQEIFGKENFYIELMDHDMELERKVKQELLDIAKALSAPLVATNDLHYVKAEDAIAQDALLCINSNSNLEDPNRFKFDGSGYYVKSTEEMCELFEDLPDAITNTREISERCNSHFEPEQGRYMPHIAIPEIDAPEDEKRVREVIILAEKKKGEKAKYTKINDIPDEMAKEGAYFIEETQKGLAERFPEGITEEYKKQLDFEIDTILGMGFPSYFLVVADFVQWAKNNNVAVGPGRGSAAGSLVAYALKITDMDPIQYKLVFERFLNPERVSLPDIDIDFEEGGRNKVVDYCAAKYGSGGVAQIMTYGKLKAKQAIRDAARIMGYEYADGDFLSKEYPPGVDTGNIADYLYKPERAKFTDDEKFDEAMQMYNEGESFRNYVEHEERYEKIVELAMQIENLTRNWGVHASGVLVSSTPIVDVIPLMRRGTDGAIVTQFEAHACEDLGLVKMDFLGLKNLNTNKACLENIVRGGKEPVDLTKIPMDDKKTFEMIGGGHTFGIFQLESTGMRALLMRMRPTTFDDISATIALFRPGPMGMNAHNDFADRKNGRKPIKPIHPEVDEALEDILGDTYGLVVFQEQIQFAARKLAGFTMGQADSLRRAMGKKNVAELEAAREPFEAGMIANGYSKGAVKAVWDVFQPFASYAFNRAHSACYAMNGYYNAYLKANYPLEYMSALLTTFAKDKDKTAIHLAECRRMNIVVEVPDVNRSHVDFAPDGERILFGLGAIRNVGEGMAEMIVKAREEQGEFTDFNDFLRKVPGVVCNKRKIESLIKAGAFDSFGHTRRSLITIHMEAVDNILPVKQKEAQGQLDIFSVLGIEDESTEEALEVQVPRLDEFDKRLKLDFEKEMLGLYVSDHPLASLATAISNRSDFSLASLQDEDAMNEYKTNDPKERGKPATVAGMITSVSTRIAKNSGNTWGLAMLEDLSGSAEIAFFGKRYDECKNNLISDSIVQVEVKVQVEEDGSARLVGNKVIPLNLSLDNEIKDVTLTVSESLCTPKNIEALKDILSRYPGESPVFLKVSTGKGAAHNMALPDKLRVDDTSAFRSEVKALLGA